jgi:hypothetical protein|tara:strand:+ start:1907 stop:2392 length:486 start_codon:yes stop_codon:yes gene_type:complete
MAQRYYGTKDLATIEKFNRELLGEPNISDDGIIDQFIILYKVSVYDTETNMYGESSEGKVYKQGVKLPCIVDAEDFDFDISEFGADNRQNVSFAFQRAYLVEVDVRPDIGDIFKWNEGYFEVNTYNENQLVGGQPDNSHSIVVQAHLVRMPTNNLEEYRGF